MSRTNPATRNLTLLRHAKSSWKNPDLADIERPLSKRGRRDAVTMAARILGHDVEFTAIYASPAPRTRETLAHMLPALPAQDARIVFDQRLYTFQLGTMIDTLKQLDDGLLDVLVIGHNPALQDSIGWLTGQALERFPTAACARLTLKLPRWADLHAACAELDWLLTPHES